ncbi:MAG: efflux RND transporter permease subunit [Alphaproteobacteria bacterium]|jgi:HAE1 family hydrophobic/amphiphilic exporter-1|nr:efflux RND transporter permease subunit [Alphaproteobacteria bacterium]
MIAFFTARPVFAAVLALVVVLFGLVALLVLPVARYPDITPPQVRTSAVFTGGDANTVAESVAIPLEQAINGVDDLIYVESTSGNDGRAVVAATFAVGTDPDLAAVDVLNAVNEARPQLPATVQDRGVTIDTASPQLTAVISLTADAARFDELFVSNYASINIVDRIRRLPGVGRVVNFTRRDYAMRLWLDPQKLDYFALDPVDVIAAVRRQNAAFAGGAVGAAPAPEGQDFALTTRAEGRLATVEEFEDIVLLAEPDGTVVTVGDVARVELGAQTYGSAARFSGEQAAQIGIFQSPDANALDLLGAIDTEMAAIAQRFPAGVDYEIGFDTSKFVEAAVREVVVTLGQAILLVVLVVYVFLQKWRTTVIPSLAIPIALVGAFGFMFVFGFSVNQLTLLGLILAVGLVVDDAIVVVENVERHLADGEDRATATLSAMREVLGPILATTAVLFALFVPVAFIPGISGRLYNQFSLTVAIAVGLSTLMSLTLTPALARVVLKPPAGEPALPFRWFNRGFDAFGRLYTRLVTRLVGLRGVVAVVMLVVVGVTAVLFVQRPTGFVPSEDQGYFIVNVQLPEAASFQRTRDVVFALEDRLLRAPGVADVVAVAGRSFIGNVDAPYFGFLIPIMADWSVRGPEQSVEAVIAGLRPELAARQDASIQVFNAPPIPGVGSTGAVRLQFQGLDFQEPAVMAREAGAFIAALNERAEVGRAFTTFTAGVPRLDFELKRERAERAGVEIGRLFDTTQAFLGAAFVNEFTRFGQTYRVFSQAEAEARDEPRDLADLAVRNEAGEMVPLDVLIDAEMATGPQAISRYNLFPAVEIQAQPAPGVSSGELVAAVEATAAERLGGDFGFEWTGSVFQQKQAGGWAPIVFALAVVFVVLVLAAQFESLAMPVVVALAVPFAVLGAMVGLAVAGLDFDVFGQIGVLMLVGLSAKNAILIVQFARYLQDGGREPVAAAVEAARLRLRPILMTALSFVLGVLPLALSTGAGANARISLGVTVVGGMTAATVLSLLLVPSLYVVVERTRRRLAD